MLTQTEIVSQGTFNGEEQPLLTVAIPMFNAGARIQVLLNDIRAQSPASLQLVVLDDNSEDDSLEYARESLNKFTHAPWLLVRHVANIGAGGARRSLLQFVTGSYVWFMDSDDRLPADAFETVLEGLAVLPPKMILVTAVERRSFVTKEVHIVPGCTGCAPELTPLEAAASLLSGSMTSYLWNKIIPAEALAEERMSTLRRSEDVATLLSLFHAGYGTYSISRSAYVYEVRPDSVSQSWQPGQKQFMDAVADVVRLARTFFPSQELRRPILRFQYRSGVIGALNNPAKQGESPRVLAEEARLLQKHINERDLVRLARFGFLPEALTLTLIRFAPPLAGWAFYLKERIRRRRAARHGD